MSDASDEEKTEQPTEKKLRDAIESGDVPSSREAPLFAFLAATLIAGALMLRDAAGRLVDALIHLLDNSGGWALGNGADAASLIGTVELAGATFLVPFFVLFIVAGLAVSFAQHLPSVVPSRIAPDFGKLSPMAGLKRLLGKQGFIEFLKGCFKLMVIGAVVALVLNSQREVVLDALFAEPVNIPSAILGLFVRLLAGVVTAFVLLAAGDVLLSRASWNKRMRMSRQEIKEEMRQAEGDPMVKAKRRSLAMDRARRRMIKDVPRATVVIANPTHYAIALRYVRHETAAPVVVAKGQDLVALKIREIAESHGIAVIEDKLLARSMYDHVDIAKAIPSQFYKAVAEIIHYLQNKNSKKPSPRTISGAS